MPILEASLSSFNATERFTDLGKLNFLIEPIFNTASKKLLNSKVVEIDQKIIISLC